MSYDPFVHRLPLGRVVNLDVIPTTAEPFHSDRKAAEKEHEALRLTLRDWQYKLYAEGKRKLLVVLQALDAGGQTTGAPAQRYSRRAARNRHLAGVTFLTTVTSQYLGCGQNRGGPEALPES